MSVASARLESRLTLLKLNSLQPFRFGFCRAAYPFQSSRESSVSFDICRVARKRFLVTLDGVRDLILTKKHAAGVGYKSGTQPVDGRARKFGCLPALRCGFCSSPLLSKNASKRAVWSRLIGHGRDGLLDRIGRFWQLVLLFVDTAEDGPAITVFRAQLHSDFELLYRVVEVSPRHFQNAESIRWIWGTRVEARSRLHLCGGPGEIFHGGGRWLLSVLLAWSGIPNRPLTPEPYTGNNAFQVVHGVLQVANRPVNPYGAFRRHRIASWCKGRATTRPDGYPPDCLRRSENEISIKRETGPGQTGRVLVQNRTSPKRFEC